MKIKLFENFDGTDPLETNKDAYELFVNISKKAGWYCMDNATDKKKFLGWLETYELDDMSIMSWPDIQRVVKKNKSWCTDNEGDMRALLSVLFKEDLMGDYAEDYEPFDELVKMYK